MNHPRSRSFGRPPPVASVAPGGDALGDVALDAIALPFGDQRSHLRLRVEGVADPHLGEGSGERLDQLVVTVLADDDPRQRRADLPGQEALGARQ